MTYRQSETAHPVTGAVTDGERTAAVLAHVSSLVAMVATAGWLSFVGPLVMWVLYRNSSTYVRQAAAGAFNFNLGMWVMSIAGWVCFFTLLGIPVALVLWLVSGVGQVVMHLVGTAKAVRGEPYRYPFQIPVLN